MPPNDDLAFSQQRHKTTVSSIESSSEHAAKLARFKSDIEEGMQGDGVAADKVFADLRAKFAVAEQGK